MGVGNSAKLKSACPEQRLGCFASRRDDLTVEVRRKNWKPQRIGHSPTTLDGLEKGTAWSCGAQEQSTGSAEAVELFVHVEMLVWIKGEWSLKCSSFICVQLA